jgi:Family of unknown function (DUF6855)
MWVEESADPPTMFCQVGSTQLKYQLRSIDDLHAWLVEQGDWVDLGAADEQKPAKEGTVEAWGRSEDNPVGGWYGLRKGYRGRFGMYLPPLLEVLGKAELTHEPRNTRSAPSARGPELKSGPAPVGNRSVRRRSRTEVLRNGRKFEKEAPGQRRPPPVWGAPIARQQISRTVPELLTSWSHPCCGY